MNYDSFCWQHIACFMIHLKSHFDASRLSILKLISFENSWIENSSASILRFDQNARRREFEFFLSSCAQSRLWIDISKMTLNSSEY